MARRTLLFHREHDGVPIAVRHHPDQSLDVAAGFTLGPYPLAASRKIHAASGAKSFTQAVRRLPGDHKYPVGGVLDHARQAPAFFVEIQTGQERLGGVQPAGVQGHTHLGVDTQPIKRRHLGGCRYAAGVGDRAIGDLAQCSNFIHVEAVHPALVVYRCDQKAAAERGQPTDACGRRFPGILTPAVTHHPPTLMIHGDQDAVARQPGQERFIRSRADDQPGCSGAEQLGGALLVPDAAADTAAGDAAQPPDQLAVVAAA